MFPVKDYMVKEIATIDSGASMSEASRVMKSKNAGYLIVLEKAQPAGIVTHGDFADKVLADNKDPAATKVSAVMSAPLITVDPDMAVNEVVRAMVKHDVRWLPVGRDGIIYGVFRARDLVRHFNDYEERVTRDIIRSLALWPV